MPDPLRLYPDLGGFIDDSGPYELTSSEFRADGQRWLLVTQSGEFEGGQLLFRIEAGRLKPVRADSLVDLNPRLAEAEAAHVGLEPSPAAEVSAVATAMRSLANRPSDPPSETRFSTASGPDGGNLACVWAIRHLVRDVLRRWITRSDSTSEFADDLFAGFGRSFEEADLDEGSIVISPTAWGSGSMRGRHGHVGLLGPRQPGGARIIYSNSSARRRWEQNFTLNSWRERYERGKHLKVLFFPIPKIAGALEVAGGRVGLEAAEAPGTFLSAEDHGPDPLAGEGPPQRGGAVFGPETEAVSADLPINRSQALKVTRWMKSNFGTKLTAAVQGTPFSIDHLCAIVCQETAYFWVSLIDRLSPREIIERCVLDASGDYPETSRSAFPVDTAEFRARYGDDFTRLLIEEANKTRALRNYGPKQWVYKGYGLFQYDLQYVKTDEAFFRSKQWYDFDICLEKAARELKAKYAATGDVWSAIKAYNGTGMRATRYANNVMRFREWCAEVPLA
ncbi:MULTISPECIES: hypothetical protein [Rhodomicrobium]|uniref:hypothetical protein n=1 Tax=Rhodomicrobium TaxID=1068 RepID=UPI000B4B1B2B|nr:MULTISPECIES: hypothetical protein [Rhodomicrobium]